MLGGSDLRQRLDGDSKEAKAMLRRALAEEHTTEEIAKSFGLGVFITMLPTLGTGFLAFVLLATIVDRLSKLALFASAVVFNPVVKWGVYGMSFGLGSVLLGPVQGLTVQTVSLSAAPAVVTRLVLGNVVLAVVAAVPSYFVALRVVERYGDDSLLGRLFERLGLSIEGVDGADQEPTD